MNYKKTAEVLLEKVGGKKNIKSLTNCATRLRFTLIDNEKVDVESIKKVDGVIDIVKSGAQYQIIIGTDVGNVMKELENLGVNNNDVPEPSQTSDKWSDRFFDTISGIFTPIIPALTAAGMLKAVLVLLDFANILTPESPTYIFLSFVSDAGFYFLPVFVAISTAMKFKANIFVAGMIGAALIHPTFTGFVANEETISLFGLSIPMVSYTASVIPSILSVWFMAYVERFADKVSPKPVKFLLKPLLTVLIVIPFTFFIFGPIGSYVGDFLAMIFDYLNSHASWLVPTLMGGVFPLLVMTGMHWSFTPIIVQSYATYNYEAIMGPGSFVSNISQGAAALAVAVKSKDSKMKQIASSAGVTALLGVTEPALFGVTMKVKNVLYCVMAGGAVGGLYAGIQGVVRYTSGTPGLASFAVFIGENPMNLVHAFISVGIGFAVTFILTWFFADVKATNDSQPIKNEEKNYRVIQQQKIKSPLVGQVVPIQEVNDITFSDEIIGKGVAIDSKNGTVYAPFDGKVTMLFNTKHALGLTNQDGVELLIHIGIDTVKLDGEGFEAFIKEGDTITQGQKLLRFDKELIQKAGYDPIVPIVITNLTSEQELVINDQKEVTQNDDLMVIL